MRQKRYKRRQYHQTANFISIFDEEESETEVSSELLHVIRKKLKKVNYSLEFERNGFILLNEEGYLCKKGNLENLDHHCVVHNIYADEDRTLSCDQLIQEKQMQKYFGTMLASRCANN